jgi:quercetin dioxygenase-like cupin family protein
MTKSLISTDASSIVPRQVLAEKVTILADHDQTGSYEVTVHDAPEGAGPPPHFHAWDEAFYVTQGEVDFVCGGIAKRVKAGGFVHVPGGTVHSFRYASATAQMVGVTSGKGSAGMFTALDLECGAAPEKDHVVAVVGRHGMTVVS